MAGPAFDEPAKARADLDLSLSQSASQFALFSDIPGM